MISKKRMNLRRLRIACTLCLVILVSCDLTDPGYYSSFSLSFDFNKPDDLWEGDFADYPEGDSTAYELQVAHATLPTDQTKKGILITGNNGSDDLFMFIKQKVAGFRPNTTYAILFNVRFASNVPTGGLGIGGAPGESVYMKAGASVTEPKKVLDADTKIYRMNIDKGQQATTGDDMINIGNIAVAANTSSYTNVVRNNTSNAPFLVTTDSKGELWLIIGTDSGYEGRTTLYYTGVDMLFNEQ